MSSLTVSEYEGAFHNGDSAFIHNWIDNETRDSHSQANIKESERFTDRSYFNANKEESPR
jgi:hypothetical protein